MAEATMAIQHPTAPVSRSSQPVTKAPWRPPGRNGMPANHASGSWPESKARKADTHTMRKAQWRKLFQSLTRYAFTNFNPSKRRNTGIK